MRTIRVLLSTAASVAIAALTTTASAQQGSFGYRSPNAFTAENLVGVGWDRTKEEGDDASGAIVVGQLSVGQSRRLSVPARVGYHRFVSDGLSLGLLGSYLEGSGTTSYMVGPRVGYSVPLGDELSLWLRAGINYNRAEFSAGLFGKAEAWNLMGAGDLLFVYTPVPHVGLIFGAIAEFGFTGETSVKSGIPALGGGGELSTDVRQMFVAATAGLLLDF